MEKILVVGGAGFIGGALCESLMGKGYDVFVIDNLAAGRLPPRGARFIHGDVTRWEAFSPLLKWEFPVIYHLAASFANRKSVLFPFVDAETNIMGTMNVIRFMKRMRGSFLVYAGSSSSYGAMNSGPLKETDPINPVTPYALSKYVGERYVQMICEPGAYLILRLFNVFGPGDAPGVYRNAIPNMVGDAARKGAIRVTDREATRDFTYIDDVAAVLTDVAGRVRGGPRNDGGLGGQVVNVCAGVERKMFDIALTIQKMVGADIEIAKPEAWDRIARRRGAPGKIRELFPFSVHFGESFQRRLEYTIDSVRRSLRDGAI